MRQESVIIFQVVGSSTFYLKMNQSCVCREGPPVAIRGTVSVNVVFPNWWQGSKSSLINDAARPRVLCSTLLSEVHCTELSEGLDTDNASQLSVAAHAFLPLAALAQSSGELSLAFAVAAQCGVVEGVLNKS